MADFSRWSNTEGAWGEPYVVKHTVTSAEDTAGSLSIKTPYAIIEAYDWAVFTSGGEKQEQDAYGSSLSGGVITIVDGTHNPTATDVLYVTVYGKGGR